MQVILLERIRKLGQMGETVTVKDGYARNFLLPKGKALRATKANEAYFESQRAQLEARNLEQQSEAQSIADKLDGQSYVLVRQAGENGQLYGSVASRDIVDAVSDGGVTIGRQQVNLDKPIKEIGLHDIEIHLYADVDAKITINVARSEEEAERQARGENVLTAGDDEDEAAEALESAEALFEEGADAELSTDDDSGETQEEETAETE